MENETFQSRVAVPLPVTGTFSYAVPDKLRASTRVGCRVLVPFKNRNLVGYVLDMVPRSEREELKEILDVLDPEPLFPPQLVPFFEWLADYYIYPLGQLIQSALPAGLNTNPFKSAALTENGRKALDLLPSRSEEREILSWVREHPGRKCPWPLQKVAPLQKKGWIRIEERLKRPAGPLMRCFVGPKEGVNIQELLAERRSPIQAKDEWKFLETLFASGPMLQSALKGKFGNADYLVKKWIKKGILESYTGAVYRNPASTCVSFSPTPHTLYPQQEDALSLIRQSLDRRAFSCFLLYGVTGSGKTEVYYRAMRYALETGLQTLLLVPEISLAFYMEGLFRLRLGDRIAIYHSGLSQGERYDQWTRIVRGEVDLVIGARSALFAPLPRLALIIVDEEHDSAYKQENNPRYQARDAAVLRAKLENGVVLLGSGTPSVQSFQNCRTSRYELLTMPERIESRPLPDVEIVDMKKPNGKGSEEEILSPELREALHQNLEERNQAILFLNRRGFHRLYLCRACGQSIRCPNCDVALTYHLRGNQLVCHYCGFYSAIPVKCSFCSLESMKPYGFGTEKLEKTLQGLWPDVRIARMDRDSTRRKGQAIQILKRFSDHQIDILVGTQMITKGYDFPGVTLVGVIAADLSLGFPDFRAAERTFQILSQVAGRAGRGTRKGRVIIQTFNPDHYAIRAAMAHDYHAFFEKERELREQLGYPPFSHLACLTLQGNHRQRTEEAVHRLGLEIRNLLARWPKRGKEVRILGPAEAPISRLKGKYRWQILVKSGSASLLRLFLHEVERISKGVLKSSGVNLILDLDPYQMI